MTTAQGASAQEWKDGWRPLVAGFSGMAVGWNVATIASGLFLKPMQADFGWSRTELSFGPIAALIVALLLPLSGILMDRVGPRRVAIAGIFMLAGAWGLFSIIPARHDAFWIAVVVLGLAGGVSNSIVFARGVAPWFERNLGLAIGMMMTGASVGAAVAMRLVTALIIEGGWRTGCRGLAVITLVVGLPVMLLWFRPPAASSTNKHASGPARASMRTIAAKAEFWKLGIGCAIAALPIGGFVGHLVPLLTDEGLDLPFAATMASTFAISVGVGRVAVGLLLDRLHPPAVVFSTLLVAAAGVALVDGLGAAAIPPAALILVIGLIGLAQGAEGDYIKFFSMRLFGVANFSRVVALMATTISLGMAAGGLVFAWVFDHFGSYRPALHASVLLYALGGLFFLAIRMRPMTGIEAANE